MTAKKDARKKTTKKKADKPKKVPWPPFGDGKSDDTAPVSSGLTIDPDPIPFTKVRYKNNCPEPTIVSTVLERDRAPTPRTMTVPPQPGLVHPGEEVEIPPPEPTDSVCAVHGTVLYRVGDEIRNHAFGGEWAPYVESVYIETKRGLLGHIYTEVSYHP